MLLFVIVFVLVALLLAGVALVALLIIVLAVAGALALGVMSASALIGLTTGRFGLALRALLVQCGVVAGIVGGVLCAALLKVLSNDQGMGWFVLIYGALAGAGVGAVLALAFEWVIVSLTKLASSRYPAR